MQLIIKNVLLWGLPYNLKGLEVSVVVIWRWIECIELN